MITIGTWVRRHKIFTALAVLLAIIVGSAAATSSSPNKTGADQVAASTNAAVPVTPTATSTIFQIVASPVTTQATSDATVAAAIKCLARTAPGQQDMLVRIKSPGLDWTAQRLGGGYIYNYSSNDCQTGPDWALATISTDPGYCAQVAWATDNPAYDETTVPAGPLRKLIGTKGEC